MDIKIFFNLKKLSTEFFEASVIACEQSFFRYRVTAKCHDIQVSIKTHMLQLQNFVILKAANNG